MSKSKGDRVVSGKKNDSADFLIGILRILVMLIVVLVIILSAVSVYRFSYNVFLDDAVSSADGGRDIAVKIDEGMSERKVAERLENFGLVEDALVFSLQLRLFKDSGTDIVPGLYTLNTSMTPTEIIQIITTQSEEDEEDG